MSVLKINAVKAEGHDELRKMITDQLLKLDFDQTRANSVADAVLRRVAGMPFQSVPISTPEEPNELFNAAVNGLETVLQQTTGYWIFQAMELELALEMASAQPAQ